MLHRITSLPATLFLLATACAPVAPRDAPEDESGAVEAPTDAGPADASPPSRPAAAGGAPGEGYRAGGNEPFWQVNFGAGAIVFEDIGGTLSARGPRPAPENTADGWRYAARSGGAPLIVTIERRFCQDSMSGRPFPHTVTVTAGGRSFEGCGGDTASLLTGGEWRVVLVEQHVPARTPTMIFGADGALTGNAGCNRYRATYEIAGDGSLQIDPAAATRMACPGPDINASESAFLSALARADRFDIAEGGALRLYAADTVVVMARR